METLIIKSGDNIEVWEINVEKATADIVGYYPDNRSMHERHTHCTLNGDNYIKRNFREQMQFGWEIAEYDGEYLKDEIPKQMDEEKE